jgi:hypothetical protein
MSGRWGKVSGRLAHIVFAMQRMIRPIVVRLMFLASIGLISFSSCLANALPDEQAAWKTAAKRLDQMHFPSPKEKLDYLRAQTKKIEAGIRPPIGMSRQQVKATFGQEEFFGNDMGGAIRDPDLWAYRLTNTTRLVVHYKDEKVESTSLYFEGDVKQRPASSDIKPQIEDATFEYLSCQLLLATYKPK